MSQKEIPVIEPLSWDSLCFQFKTGYVQMPSQQAITPELMLRVKENAAEQDYRLVYIWLAEGEQIDWPVWEFFPEWLIHADEKIKYTRTLLSSVTNPSVACPDQIKSYRESLPTAELYELAFQSGQYSRFKQDRHFPRGIFENLYSHWIERSVGREIADDVIIFEEKGRIEGMLTYQTTQTDGKIGLIAVSPQARHKGIGSLLMRECEARLAQKGIRTLEVATQRKNILACRFYEKQGFRIQSSINIYHLWL